jgi:hypothetical protein
MTIETVAWDRVASDRIWAEIDALRGALVEAREAIAFAQRGALEGSGEHASYAATLARVDNALTGPRDALAPSADEVVA